MVSLTAILVFVSISLAMEPTVLKALIDRAPEITPAPVFAPRHLRALYGRQDTLTEQTCGYWDGNADDPYTCSMGYDCAQNNLYPIFGCCVTNIQGEFVTGSCAPVENPYTSCVEYADSDLCTGDCWSSNRVCDSTYRFCAVGYSITAGSTYSNWFCQSLAGGTPSLFIFNQATDTSLPSTTPKSTTPSPTRPTTTTPIVPDGGASTPPPAETSPIETPIKSDVEGGGTNTGAIAGGVVGGLAGLALIVVGAIFFLRRAKKQERKQAFAEVSQI